MSRDHKMRISVAPEELQIKFRLKIDFYKLLHIDCKRILLGIIVIVGWFLPDYGKYPTLYLRQLL